MKKLSLLLLFSSYFISPTYCQDETRDEVCTSQDRGCGDFRDNRCQSASVSSEFTWEMIESIHSVVIDVKREGADDAMWQRICAIIEEDVPLSNAKEIGATSDVLYCTISRNDRTLQEWDLKIKSVIETCQYVLAHLQREECSGAILQITLHKNKAE